MKPRGKRLTSVILALAFVLTMLPTMSVLAAPQAIVLSNAQFHGLTQVTVNTSARLEGIAGTDIVIAAGDYTVPTSQIAGVDVADDRITVDLDPAAFASDSSVGATIATNAFGDFAAAAAIPIAPSSDPLDSVWSKITTSNPGNNSLWHNLTSRTSIRPDGPYDVPSNGPIYKIRGTINALMIVIDFPDALAKDNTGSNGMPGQPQVDRGNRIHGQPLRTAQDYYDWLAPRAHDFYDASSYGQLSLDITLVQNPGATYGDGVFTLPNTLYGDGSWEGYSFDRGGNTTTYVRDALTVARPVLEPFPGGPYDLIYVVAVENAVGISYGPMNSTGTLANTYSGRTDFKALVRIGYDTYSRWKSKAVNHETGHAIGSPDYYINGFSGYGGGQCDPNTGTADYYPMVGHWDLMGYINGPAPDFFSWMKWRFGWIRDDQVDIIATSGTTTHQLTPVETPGGTKMIVVPGPVDGTAFIVEMRQVAGVDDTGVREASTDPDPEFQNTNWDHIYGTFNSPGILMYKIDARVASLQGPLTVIDLYPDEASEELGTRLDSSVLGATSGIYSYTDAAAGITVTLDGETAAVDTVTLTYDPPSPLLKPVLSDAHFIDHKTVEFKTNMDLRGIAKGSIVLMRGDGVAARRVTINQVTPRTIRITFTALTDVAQMEGATISTNAFSFFGASDPVPVAPLEAPVLSEAEFRSLTEIRVKSDVDLSGLPAENIALEKPDGSLVPSEEIAAVTFDPETMLLTIEVNADQFPTYDSTIGTTIATTGLYSSYVPNVLDLQLAKFDPPVVFSAPSAAVPVTDRTPPVVTITGVSDGAVYTLGAVPEAGCTTEDALSGVATPAVVSIAGGNANGVGVFAVTCSGAVDNAGNEAAPVSATYTVIYSFGGFSDPVASQPAVNIANAGAVIPLKWRLVDADGNPVTDLESVRVTVADLSCDGGPGAGESEEEEYAAGASGLQNLGDGYYQFNWKTPKTYTQSCKMLELDLGEGPGMERTALFEFE